MEVSAIGITSVENPGLEPVEWIDVPPAWHAASIIARLSGAIIAGL